MRFKFIMLVSQSVLIGKKLLKQTQFCQTLSTCNMKMLYNPAKYEVLIKQYLRSILKKQVKKQGILDSPVRFENRRITPGMFLLA